MTIGKGEAWGDTVPRPRPLRVAADDADLAERLDDGSGTPTGVSSGDLLRTLGGGSHAGSTEVLRLPVDLVRVRLDDEEPIPAVAHVVIAEPWWRGGRLRGPVVVVMNAEFLGDLDVAPRGHPNDGRVEILELDATLGIRQRLQMRRRARSASHLPHPLVTTRSVRRADREFDRPLSVVVDGRRRGRARRVRVEVEPDAAVVHV